jgi:hypothetical protein
VAVAARVISGFFVAAMLASVQVTAQGSGATGLDQVKNLKLLRGDRKLLTI